MMGGLHKLSISPEEYIFAGKFRNKFSFTTVTALYFSSLHLHRYPQLVYLHCASFWAKENKKRNPKFDKNSSLILKMRWRCAYDIFCKYKININSLLGESLNVLYFIMS